jgi:hypothetical protein
VQVVIGSLESAAAGLLADRARYATGPGGSLGVIGPTRVNTGDPVVITASWRACLN